MKRSPLKRRTRLTRKSWMKRVNAKRRAEKHAERFGDQADRCRRSPCQACGAPPPSEPHHWPTVARGGKDEDTIALCSDCHTMGGRPRAFHDTPLADWEAFHGVSIQDLVEEMRSAA